MLKICKVRAANDNINIASQTRTWLDGTHLLEPEPFV